MLVMTTKVDMKKIAIVLAAVVGVILLLTLLLGGGEDTAPTAATNVSNNDGRVAFLKDFGWDVSTSPVESGQVRIPEESSQVFSRYNALQKSQGYDLSAFAGKTVMRYVYRVNNYPGATEPVYATLLVYEDQIIGGDITDSSAKGAVRGFQMSQSTPAQTIPVPSVTTTPTTAPAQTDATAAS